MFIDIYIFVKILVDYTTIYLINFLMLAISEKDSYFRQETYIFSSIMLHSLYVC